MSKPNPNEYSSFYEPYLEILPDDGSGLNELLELSLTEFNELFSELPSEKEGHFLPFIAGGILYGLILIPV